MGESLSLVPKRNKIFPLDQLPKGKGLQKLVLCTKERKRGKSIDGKIIHIATNLRLNPKATNFHGEALFMIRSVGCPS